MYRPSQLDELVNLDGGSLSSEEKLKYDLIDKKNAIKNGVKRLGANKVKVALEVVSIGLDVAECVGNPLSCGKSAVTILGSFDELNKIVIGCTGDNCKTIIRDRIGDNNYKLFKKVNSVIGVYDLSNLALKPVKFLVGSNLNDIGNVTIKGINKVGEGLTTFKANTVAGTGIILDKGAKVLGKVVDKASDGFKTVINKTGNYIDELTAPQPKFSFAGGVDTSSLSSTKALTKLEDTKSVAKVTDVVDDVPLKSSDRIIEYSPATGENIIINNADGTKTIKNPTKYRRIKDAYVAEVTKDKKGKILEKVIAREDGIYLKASSDPKSAYYLPYTNGGRPSYGKGQMEDVIKNHLLEEYKIKNEIIPEDVKEYIYSSPRKWDMRHRKPYYESLLEYQAGEITYDEFIDIYRNPSNYDIEDIHINRGKNNTKEYLEQQKLKMERNGKEVGR